MNSTSSLKFAFIDLPLCEAQPAHNNSATISTAGKNTRGMIAPSRMDSRSFCDGGDGLCSLGRVKKHLLKLLDDVLRLAKPSRPDVAAGEPAFARTYEAIH